MHKNIMLEVKISKKLKIPIILLASLLTSNRFEIKDEIKKI